MRRIYDSPTRLFILTIARKNAKTAFVAMLLLLHLAGPESKPNSQLYSAAQSRDQASLLFAYAAKMVRMSPDLDAYISIKDSTKQLVCPERGTMYRALSAEAKTSFGVNPAFAVHDELGQVVGPTSPLYDAIETAAGAQEEPLSLVISTQASTDADLLSLLIDDALTGADPTVKVEIYTSPVEAENPPPGSGITPLDPFSVKAIKLANPHYDIFMNREEVRKQAAKAKRMPSAEASYRNLVLNQRVNRHDVLFPRSVWEACSGPIDESLFATAKLFDGIDLSARGDLTSRVQVAEDADGIVHVRPRFFAPEMGVKERSDRDRVRYDLWADQGLITLTPGPTVDYAFVAREIADDVMLGKKIREIAYDRWRMDLLTAEMSKIGLRYCTPEEAELNAGSLVMVKFGQGFFDMGPAIDEVESLFAAGRVRHGGHPVLRWQSWNAVIKKDASGARKLDKSKTSGRIDGIAAMVMAIQRLRLAGKPAKSFWETESEAA